jgi:MFS family permease
LRPFNPGRIPFYYGWIILAAGSLVIIASIPGQTMGVSVFTDHLLGALELSRVRISAAYMAGTLISALLMTWAGRMYDRIGARETAAGAVVFLALFLLFFTRIDTIFRGISGLFGGVASAPGVTAFILVTLGFLGIRFFGQGVLTLVSRTMVMRWFETRRGRVAAWLGVATSAGFSYSPRVLQHLIDGRGWRGAWFFLAVLLLSIALPLVLLFYRDTPERCGLKMEEGMRPLRIHKKSYDRQGPDATLKEARCDPRYWAYALALTWWSLYNTAITFHVVDLFASRGVSAADAVAVFLPVTVISVAFNFLGSWASDSMDLPPLYFIIAAGFAAAGLGILNPAAGWSRVVLITGMGISGGLWSVLSNVAWPRLYGREHLGEISGSVMSLLVAGSAAGPWLFSVLRRPDGDYGGVGLFGILGALAIGLFGIAGFNFRKSPSGTGGDPA